jgi:hypothetical protein
MEKFILGQLDRAGLPHSTFSGNALSLIVRSSEGVLRRARNLCISSLLEVVRDKVREVGIKQVNKVLMQPHWRENQDLNL